MEKASCMICGQDAQLADDERHDGQYYTCPLCGKYIVESTFRKMLENNNLLRSKACLYYYVTQVQKNKRDGTILHFFGTEDWEEGYEKNQYFVSYKSITNLFPKNLNEKIEKIITNLGNLLRYLGNDFFVDYTITDYDEIISDKIIEQLFYMLWVDDGFGKKTISDQAHEMLMILEEAGYIKPTLDGKIQKRYTLTAEGWLKYQELERDNQNNQQVFIAMWFDDKMKLAKDTIMNAIRDCGYLPVIINEKEYNDFIVPEILYEIRKSNFMVADFTGNRGGVYFEAGYAKGLDKQVIMTCKQDFFDVHFDTKQISHVLWNDEGDLYNRLKKRIEATVGKAY